MNLEVRAVDDGDVEAIHEILMSPHVIAGSMRVPLGPVSGTRERLQPPPGVHQLAAVAEDRVVGFAELITYPEEPRHRHAGEINMIATHGDWLRRGVARTLLDATIDLADNWLNLSRLSLLVFTDNPHAIHLYEQLGFRHEGTRERFGYGSGEWMDAYLMGRLRDA